MTDATIGFGILGSGNMARVYADALATQVTGGRLVAVALGSRADTPLESPNATEPTPSPTIPKHSTALHSTRRWCGQRTEFDDRTSSNCKDPPI